MVIIEYRDHSAGEWKRSDMAWTLGDIDKINKTVGYQKYRLRKVDNA